MQNVIECRSVWKVFGNRSAEAVQAAKNDNACKAEIMERLHCVLGVADVSFTVGEGEIFCIMGLSGSGKSTLIRQINRLVDSTAGEILIEGQNINALNGRALRRMRGEKMAMAFQNVALLPHRTVLDNVALGLELRGYPTDKRYRVAREKLELVSLGSWGHRYPEELSGGMKQRVGLARAMASDPDILLMDEPFSALDPLIRRELQDQFLSLARMMSKTMVFITHDLDEAIRIGTRIAIMKDARIVQVGTPEEIVTKPIDDYVANFVAGISRLDLVTARTIMQPISELDAKPTGCFDRTRSVLPSATLNDVVSESCESAGSVLVTENGQRIGFITHRALLLGIQGQPAERKRLSE